MKSLKTRIIGTLALGVTAFLAGAADTPTPADAHCGGHAWSCGTTSDYGTGYCDGWTWVQWINVYANECSGTCYNGGTAGCCSSPEACADAPCKPGGCGGPCGFLYDYQEFEEQSSNCVP